MKRIIVVSTLVLGVIVNVAIAGHEVVVKEAGIIFTLPDKWTRKAQPMNRAPTEKADSAPLMLAWARASLLDPKGRTVSPGLNLIVSQAPPNAQIVIASATLMHGRRWPFKAFLTGDKDGLRLPNTLGYLTEFSPVDDVVLKAFVVHILNDGKFVEIILSATQEVFPEVEGELRSIIRSLRLIE